MPLGAAATEVVVEEELLFTAVLLFVVELEILLGPLLPPLLPLVLVLSELDEAITACDDDEDDDPESLPEYKKINRGYVLDEDLGGGIFFSSLP